MFLSDEGCLLRRADSGENHTLLVFFLRASGLKFALARKLYKADASSSLPDFFECGEATLQQKDSSKPAFLKEFTARQRYPEIARHYKTFTAAAALTRFYEKNLLHMEHFDPAWHLLQKALASFAEKHEPAATLFKTLFLFAQKEGYAVQAQWLGQTKPANRDTFSRILRHPVGASGVDNAIIEDGINELNRFFAEATDLLPLEF